MHSVTLSPDSLHPLAATAKPRLNPLRALMDMWERDGVDDDEGGADVSVMLSSMIGQQFFAPDQD